MHLPVEPSSNNETYNGRKCGGLKFREIESVTIAVDCHFFQLSPIPHKFDSVTPRFLENFTLSLKLVATVYVYNISI